jgi:hypothetical protein
MTIKYRVIEDDEFSGAIVQINGEPISVGSDHPNFEEIRDILLTQDGYSDDDNLEALSDLLEPIKDVSNRLTVLSERFTFGGGTIYFDGDPLDNALTQHIIRLVEGGKDAKDTGYPAFVNMAEKLYTNPSKKSRKHFFEYIQTHGFTLHPDGDFIAYKGVRNDGTSSHAGYAIVDGEIFGEYDPESNTITKSVNIPNSIGAIVSIPRDMVDEDRGVPCSTGLHAGTYEYAKSFAPRLLTVKINPRDVVSVPSDSNNQKLRVSRYEVIDLADGKIETPTYPVEAPVADDVVYDEFLNVVEEDKNAAAEDDAEALDQYSDDDLADALSDQTTSAQATSPDGSFQVTVTVTPNAGARDSRGRFVSGQANPGKTQPRDSKGHFLPTH